MVKKAEKRSFGWLLTILVGLLVVVLMIAGIVAVGNAAKDSLIPSARYKTPFDQIQCPVPPGMERETFLEEVQYLGQFSQELSVLDQAALGKLQKAFSDHPRVARVDEIKIDRERKIVVKLTFKDKLKDSNK